MTALMAGAEDSLRLEELPTLTVTAERTPGEPGESPLAYAVVRRADLEALSGRQMDPVTIGVAMLTGVAIGAAGSAAYEVMKAGFRRVLAKLGIDKNVDLAEQPHPPGTPVVLVIIVNKEK